MITIDRFYDNKEKLQDLDYLLTGSFKPVSRLISLGQGCNPFALKTPSHAGRLIIKEGRHFIADIQGGRKPYLQINPIETLFKKGFWADKLLYVIRNPAYNNAVTRCARIELMLQEIKDHALAYDYSGVFEQAFHWLKDCKNKVYCSEWIARDSYLDGAQIISGKTSWEDTDDISPNELKHFKGAQLIL